MSDLDDNALTALHGGDATEDPIKRALEAVRTHLGMKVAYLSEFVGDRSIFREVDAPGLEQLIKPGDSQSLDDVYCRRILDGSLPELMPNAADEPLAAAMPITKALGIGAHMSVPIRLPDGRPYGMFCCLSFEPNQTLNQRDLNVMKVFADMAAHQIGRELELNRALEEKRARIREVIDSHAFTLVFQPIWRFGRRAPVGFESLCRFTPAPYRSPDKWFREAAEAGRGVELELQVIREALRRGPEALAGAYVSVNASPEAILDPAFSSAFRDAPIERIVLEITEHAAVSDYALLGEALRPLRQAGLRLAVDDAGAGYASLQHIVNLLRDILKLDMSLTRNIDTDAARRALASALIFFARETGSSILAEGIETPGELETLRILGVGGGQGYLLGKPMEVESAARLLTRSGEPAVLTA